MSILDNAKQVAAAVHEINNLELYQRVLNLHSDIIELVEQNTRLREENKELTKTVSLKQKMNFREPFFYQEGDNTPFCPSCWESQTTPVHIIFSYENEVETRWDCPSCKTMYLIPQNRRRTRTTFDTGSGGGPNDWMAR
jgi:hypothetical protein